MKETLGDIDYLVVSDAPEVIMDYFASMPEVDQVVGKGPSKTFVKLNNGMDADLLVVPKESFGSALQYFTGSKEHGVALRKIESLMSFLESQCQGNLIGYWGPATPPMELPADKSHWAHGGKSYWCV